MRAVLLGAYGRPCTPLSAPAEEVSKAPGQGESKECNAADQRQVATKCKKMQKMQLLGKSKTAKMQNMQVAFSGPWK